MIILTGFFLLIVFPIMFGVKKFKHNRLFALALFSVPIITVGWVVSFLYPIFYTTTPDALSLEVTKAGDHFEINGVWNKKYEKYSFGTDYIAILTDKNINIDNADMEPFSIERSEDRYMLNGVRRAIESNPNYDSTKELRLFEIKLEREFTYYFKANPQASMDDFIVQYVHVYDEPMGPLLYWVKTVNGEFSDPQSY